MSAAAAQVGALAPRSITRTARQPASAIPPLALPGAAHGRERGRPPSVDEPAGLSDRLLPRVRARGALHPGRALLDDERGHRPGARHPDGLPEPALADVDAGLGADRRAARRHRRARPRAGGLLHAVGLVTGVRFASGPGGIAVLLLFAALVSLGFGALGIYLALRTGSGEAIQGLFPLLFVFLFLSSMNAPRDLIESTGSAIATVNPVSYLIEACGA